MGTVGSTWRLGSASRWVLLLATACGGCTGGKSTEDTAVGAGGTSSGGSSSGQSSSGQSSSGGSATHGSSSSSSNGGGATGGSGGSPTTGTAAAAGEGGEASSAGGAGGEGGEAAGGSGGSMEDPWCVPEAAVAGDDCAYPESLGGGVSASACGVTEGAWYALGDIESVVWPERADEGDGDGIMTGQKPQLLMQDDGTAFLLASCNIQHWDGNAWQPIPLPEWVNAPQDCLGAIDLAGRLVLGFTDAIELGWDYPLKQLRVIRQTDADWEDLGLLHEGGAGGELYATKYTFAFDPSNHPFIFYEIWYNSGSSTVVRRWSGVEWTRFTGGTGWDFEDVGDMSVGAGRILVTPDGRPVVALEGGNRLDDFVNIVEWTGDAWNLVASGNEYLPNWETRNSFRLTLDASGVPVASWGDGEALRILRSSAGETSAVVLATEAVLEPLVELVRWDARVEEGDIRVSRAEDCRWTGLSASHLGGGVSNSEPPSLAPSLAVTADRVCVAWSEHVARGWRVFVRCHD